MAFIQNHRAFLATPDNIDTVALENETITVKVKPRLSVRQTGIYVNANSISSSLFVIAFFLPVSLKPIRR